MVELALGRAVRAAASSPARRSTTLRAFLASQPGDPEPDAARRGVRGLRAATADDHGAARGRDSRSSRISCARTRAGRALRAQRPVEATRRPSGAIWLNREPRARALSHASRDGARRRRRSRRWLARELIELTRDRPQDRRRGISSRRSSCVPASRRKLSRRPSASARSMRATRAGRSRSPKRVRAQATIAAWSQRSSRASAAARRGRRPTGTYARMASESRVCAARDGRATARHHGARGRRAACADTNADLRFVLGSRLRARQPHRRCRAHVPRSHRGDPKHAEALNYLGYMLAERGQKLDEAVALIQRALVDRRRATRRISTASAGRTSSWAQLDQARPSLERAAAALPARRRSSRIISATSTCSSSAIAKLPTRSIARSPGTATASTWRRSRKKRDRARAGRQVAAIDVAVRRCGSPLCVAGVASLRARALFVAAARTGTSPAPEAATAWAEATRRCRGVAHVSRRAAAVGPRRARADRAGGVNVAVDRAGAIGLEARAFGRRSSRWPARPSAPRSTSGDDDRVITARAEEIVEALVGVEARPERLLALLAAASRVDPTFDSGLRFGVAHRSDDRRRAGRDCSNGAARWQTARRRVRRLESSTTERFERRLPDARCDSTSDVRPTVAAISLSIEVNSSTSTQISLPRRSCPPRRRRPCPLTLEELRAAGPLRERK